jgi:hypothetical protein
VTLAHQFHGSISIVKRNPRTHRLMHLGTPQKFRRGRNRALAFGTIHGQPLPLPHPPHVTSGPDKRDLQSCLPSNELSPAPELLQQILVFCTFASRPDSLPLSPRRGLLFAPSTPPFHFLSFDGSASTQCGVDVLKL